MSYTLPLSEAGTQLQNLVKRTRATHTPVLLTSEETSAPVAVVLEIDAYEHTQRQQQQLYQLQLLQLKQMLERVTQHWEDCTLRQECVESLQDGIQILWDVCPEGARGLCASLTLVVNQLAAEHLTLAQVAALQFAVKLLRYSTPDANDVEVAYRKLTESGIPPTISLDKTTIQSYIDEL